MSTSVAYRTGIAFVLAAVLGSACGPSRSVDRVAPIPSAADRRDGSAGRGGTGGAGGSGGSSAPAQQDAASNPSVGGTGGGVDNPPPPDAAPDVATPPPDLALPPDMAAPPPAPPMPDAAPDLPPPPPPDMGGQTPYPTGTTECPATPPPGDDVIANFEGGVLTTAQVGTRGGTTFMVIAIMPGTTGAASAAAIPPHCGSSGAMQFSGMPTDTTGPLVRALFRSGSNSFYDASAYKGVRLWMRALVPAAVRIKISDRYTAQPGGICVLCSDHFEASMLVDTEWHLYTILWSQLRQRGVGDARPALTTAELFGIEISSPKTPPSYTLFVDDVSFVR